MTLVAPAVPSMLGIDVTLVLQVEQRPIIVVTAKDNTSALTAVTSVRATIGIVLDMTKVHGASATLSRATIYLNVIYKIGFHNK